MQGVVYTSEAFHKFLYQISLSLGIVRSALELNKQEEFSETRHFLFLNDMHCINTLQFKHLNGMQDSEHLVWNKIEARTRRKHSSQ